MTGVRRASTQTVDNKCTSTATKKAKTRILGNKNTKMARTTKTEALAMKIWQRHKIS